jgi:molecular chaperone HtpG
MRDLSRFRQDLLLNEQAIATYLAQVAPVPFAEDFKYGRAIEERLAAAGGREPIEVSVAKSPVRKLYRDITPIPGKADGVRMEEIEFVEFADVDTKVAALGWIGHHQYVRSIPVGLGIRGLRARVGDVQVGESSLFDESFKEPRFNGWSIGEIHVFDRRIVPNARRDNFEVNHHYYNLLAQIGPLAGRIANTCRTRSISRTAVQIVENMIAEADAKLDARRRVERAELSRIKGALARARLKLKSIDDETMRRQFSRRLDRLEKRVAAQKPARGAPVVAVNEALALISKIVLNRGQAQKLTDAIKQLCS